MRTTLSPSRKPLCLLVALIIIVALLHSLASKAQNVGIGTTTPAARLHVTDSVVLFSATGEPTIPHTPLNLPAGAGRRMLWLPHRAAFRMGYVAGNNWDLDSIGYYSVAGGYNTRAKNSGDIAFGMNNIAAGSASTSFGYNNIASAFGTLATGVETRATGYYASSFGASTEARGAASISTGSGTIAKATYSLVIGTYNDDTDNPVEFGFDPTDRVFQIGIGNGGFRGNAMTVLRNGNVGIGTVAPLTPLAFPPFLGKKISLYPGGTGDAGFGVFGNELRIHSDYAGADITFGYDNYSTGFTEHMRVRGSGNVGIGTTNPTARFHVNNGTILFTGPSSLPGAPGPPPASGAGTRMMWYANKGAFRSGGVAGVNWDEAETGQYSFASGNDTRAKGYTTTAMGQGASATADWSTAIGYYCTSSGVASRAIGNFCESSGNTSTAIGYVTTASGRVSTAMGSTVSTNGFEGAFIIGDNSRGATVNSSAANEMTLVFAGGYRMFSNSAATVGVQLLPGANAWSIVSDVRKKENFLPVNGENILDKISGLQLGSWNYTGQDAKAFRHYGPFAQEFYRAFGHDQFGTIGNDTTINQADFDGINIIAIQALEARTRELRGALEELKETREQVAELRRMVETLMNQGKAPATKQ